MEELVAPDVKSYLNVNLFLRDIYNFQKTQDKKFSYESWAKKMDVTSKSYLRFAVLGQRNISEKLTQKISDSLNFSEPDRKYFTLLVLYSQCSDPKQKKVYGKSLTDLLRNTVSVSQVAASEPLLAKPLTLIVRNILTFTDVPKTVEFLSRLLGTPANEIQEILVNLENLGLISNDSGQWRAHQDIVKIEANGHSEEVRKYHRLSLQKAIEAQSLPVQERYFRSLCIAMSGEEYSSYLSDISAFAQQTLAKFNSSELVSRRIYQINLNAIPWTATASRPGDSKCLDL